jgi:hypothetical protein
MTEARVIPTRMPCEGRKQPVTTDAHDVESGTLADVSQVVQHDSFVKPAVPGFEFAQDDIQIIQALYFRIEAVVRNAPDR